MKIATSLRNEYLANGYAARETRFLRCITRVVYAHVLSLQSLDSKFTRRHSYCQQDKVLIKLLVKLIEES
jgi:hypothetical protein